MEKLVTRESLKALLSDERGHEFVQHVVGRALVALFNRQTESEKNVNDTQVWNSVGFSSSDAKSGSLTAKYYLKHRCLLDWQVAKWTQEFRGRPRLCKYVRQLNEIANIKAQHKEAA